MSFVSVSLGVLLATINPQRMCKRVTVLSLSVCVSVTSTTLPVAVRTLQFQPLMHAEGLHQVCSSNKLSLDPFHSLNLF